MKQPKTQLVGGLRMGKPSPGDYSFYGNLLSRLPKEVKHAGDLTRYVAFDYLTAGNDSITFLGIEVDRIETIPDGLMAWEINGSRLTVLESGKPPNSRYKRDATTGLSGSIGRNRTPRESNEVAWEAEIEWGWRRVTAAAGKQRLFGEFSVQVPGEWTASGEPEYRFFAMTANCYIAPGKPGPDDAVELVDYNPSWPEQFNEFSAYLRGCLGDAALKIEHFGSTAIPGMTAKPVIDVLVQVPSFSEAKQRAIPLFNHEEWEYWWYGNHPVFIKREALMGRRTHHVHMMTEGPEFQKRLAFRDWLRSHPEDTTAYAQLKQRLADCHREDRENYTDAKAAFVKRIVVKANEVKNKEPI